MRPHWQTMAGLMSPALMPAAATATSAAAGADGGGAAADQMHPVLAAAPREGGLEQPADVVSTLDIAAQLLGPLSCSTSYVTAGHCWESSQGSLRGMAATLPASSIGHREQLGALMPHDLALITQPPSPPAMQSVAPSQPADEGPCCSVPLGVQPQRAQDGASVLDTFPTADSTTNAVAALNAEPSVHCESPAHALAHVAAGYCALAEACWAEEPGARPAMGQVVVRGVACCEGGVLMTQQRLGKVAIPLQGLYTFDFTD